MMNMNRRPLLSILIPTYNRADCLEFNLKHLVSQLDEIPLDMVEVIVSDNCSSDRTEEVFKNFSRYKGLKFLRAEKNIGAELNCLKLLHESGGQFVWIFGDDEVLCATGLSKVVSLLEKNKKIGLLHITQDGHTNLEEFNSERKHSDPSIEIFNNSAEFLEKVSYNLSFITSNIFNRELIQKSETPANFFIGSQLNQQGLYLQAALKADYNIYFTDRVFSQLLNNTGSYKLFEVFGKNQQVIFSHFKKLGLKNRTIFKINNDLLKFFFPQFIVLTKSSKAFEKESAIRILFSSFKSYKYFWFYCFPLLLIPESIRFHLYKWVSVIRRLFRNRKRS